MGKGLFWSDPNESIQIIKPTEEAIENYGINYYGDNVVELEPKHMEALKAGKMLAWNDSEYATFVVVKKDA